MKKVLFIGAMLLCGMMMFNSVNAQSKDEIMKIRKERKEIAKMTKDERKSKVSKEAKDEAKSLEKDGWKVPAGALPLARQLDKSYNLQSEYDEEMMPKWLFGEAKSVGAIYDAAKMSAMTLAKEDLAGKVATEVAVMVETAVDNGQISQEEATSFVGAVSRGHQEIAQSIGRVVPVIELYREKGKNTEVQIRIAYRSDMIMKAAKDVIRKELEKIGSETKDKVDALFGE